MSKKTLYGQTHNRVVTSRTGTVRVNGRTLTTKQAKMLMYLYTRPEKELIEEVARSVEHHWALKDSKYNSVRAAVAKTSDTFHDQLVTDPHWMVRLATVKASTTYHDQFVNDENWWVREAVARVSDKYHDQLVSDEHWTVRLTVARASKKYHHILKDDEDGMVREAVRNYKEKTEDDENI